MRSIPATMFLCNILTPEAHPLGFFQVAKTLCPWRRRGRDWTISNLVRNGKLSLLRILLAERAAGEGTGPRYNCYTHDANAAAEAGYLEIIQELRVHGVHCSSKSADRAAAAGMLDVVDDLRAHG